MQASFKQLLTLIHALSAERNLPRLYEQIIEAAQDLTAADGTTLYILEGRGEQQALHHEIMYTRSLNIRAGEPSQPSSKIAPIALWHADGQPNHDHLCAYVWHTGEAVHIADTTQESRFDLSGVKQFDAQKAYYTASLLTSPLQNHEGDIIGVLQLINAQQADGRFGAFSAELQEIALALASFAAVTLDKQRLIEGHKALLDAFIQTIAKAIDAKSAHTSAHCQRVPVITELLAQAACEVKSGPLKDFSLNDDEWYELRVAAWLHDCGKLATPDTLLDKATKLHAFADRIETVKARFAARRSQIRLQAHKQAWSTEQLDSQLKALRDDCEFIQQANRGGEAMSRSDQKRVQTIAQQTWLDDSDQVQPLLTPEEVEMLCIERGTLSASERREINRHIDVTIDMLESLPFPKNLEQVPEYAGGHHEKVDGSGFPKGLTGDEMSWPARMMAIADVFEALTSADRPYKSPMPLSQALGILRNMRDNRHIDADLYRLFLQARVWESYANKYLLPEQRDVESITVFL